LYGRKRAADRKIYEAHIPSPPLSEWQACITSYIQLMVQITMNSEPRTQSSEPKTQNPPPTIATLHDIGELGAIERVIRTLPGRQDVVVGAGDDCAIVRAGSNAVDDLVLTSDPVIAGIHFTTDAEPESVGRKALGRVLSDIAAMGAEPRWVLVDIVAPGETPVAVIDGIYSGMGKLAEKFSVAIVGGDMAEGASLEVHVFGVGAVPRGKGVLRSTARVGDLVFVTGGLGGSRLGRHLQVKPHINEGLLLRDWASAMIDVSDGLASDLRHLLDMSGVGCDLCLDKIPISKDTEKMNDGQSAVEHALYDGEDFELLFAIPAERRNAFIAIWKASFNLPCAEIGVITSSGGIIRCICDGRAPAVLARGGYSHF